MIPEFIAWDKERNEWCGDKSVVVSLDGSVYFVVGMDRYTLPLARDVDIYPYIHRKDKDGNKVYEGSLVKFGKHTEAVLYNKEKSRYTWGGWQFESLRGFDNEAEVIGHIAEEG